jgi:hypothetical protein
VIARELGRMGGGCSGQEVKWMGSDLIESLDLGRAAHYSAA